MSWSFNPFTGNLDLVGSGGGTVVFEGEVETFAELPETVGNPAIGASYLVRSSTGVWLVSRKQAGIWIRRYDTGVRATDWEYGGDYPVNSVNGQTGNVSLTAADVSAAWSLVLSNQNITGDTTLSSGRNRRITLVAANVTANVDLPSTGNQAGDVITLVASFFGTNTLTIRRQSGTPPFSTVATLNSSGQSFTFVSDGTATGWTLRFVDTHTHDASAITSGTLNIAQVPTGTTSTTVALGNHTHSDLHTRSHAMTGTSDHTAGNWSVFYSNGSGQVTELGLGAANTVLTSNGASSAPTFAAAASGGTKTYAFWSASSGNQPPSSGFMTLDTRNSIAVLDADDATTESAIFVGVMPEAASLASGLIVRIHFMATTATSGNVRWSVSFERGNTDLDSDSFDTATAATTATSGTSGIPAVSAITCTSIDSITAGDPYRLRIQRLGADAADTMTGDAEIYAVELRSAA